MVFKLGPKTTDVLSKNKILIAIVAALSVLAILSIIYFAPNFNNSRSASASFQSSEQVITLYKNYGEVLYRKSNDEEFQPLLKNSISVPRTTSVQTREGSAYLLFENRSLHLIKENTNVSIVEVDKGVTLEQEIGDIIHLFNPNSDLSKREYNVKTPGFTASVRGTTFEVEVANNETTLSVLEGKVEAQFNSKSQEVLDNEGINLQRISGENGNFNFDALDKYSQKIINVLQETIFNRFLFQSVNLNYLQLDKNDIYPATIEVQVDKPESPIEYEAEPTVEIVNNKPVEQAPKPKPAITSSSPQNIATTEPVVQPEHMPIDSTQEESNEGVNQNTENQEAVTPTNSTEPAEPESENENEQNTEEDNQEPIEEEIEKPKPPFSCDPVTLMCTFEP